MAEQAARGRRWPEIAVVCAFWTAVAVLGAVSRVVDPKQHALQPLVPGASLGLAAATAALWALLTPVIVGLARRYGPVFADAPARRPPAGRAHAAAHLVALLGAGVVIAMGVEAATAYLRLVVFFAEHRERLHGTGGFDPLVGVRRLYWLNQLIVYAAVLTAACAREYVRGLRARQVEAAGLRAERAELAAEAARLEAQVADARLAALRAQLDPHFLFNTLNAVSALVGSDPEGVRRMIAHLSGLLRYTLSGAAAYGADGSGADGSGADGNGARTQEVPLGEELATLAEYVAIMEIRFAGRLTVHVDADPTISDALVPPLILQPLVENAIKYGVATHPGAGRVDVVGRRDGEALRLTVRQQHDGEALDVALAGHDGAVGDAGDRPPSLGVGLPNTRARLVALYDDQAGLTLDVVPGGAVAELTLPFHTRAEVLGAVRESAPWTALGPDASGQRLLAGRRR